MRNKRTKLNKLDDFNAECIWMLVFEQYDFDYDAVLKYFEEYSEDFTKRIKASIKMAKHCYLSEPYESRVTSHVYVFYMNNGEVSIINNEQLLATNAYNKLYKEAILDLNRIINNKEHEAIRDQMIEYKEYLEGFVTYYVPHLCQ